MQILKTDKKNDLQTSLQTRILICLMQMWPEVIITTISIIITPPPFFSETDQHHRRCCNFKHFFDIQFMSQRYTNFLTTPSGFDLKKVIYLFVFFSRHLKICRTEVCVCSIFTQGLSLFCGTGYVSIMTRNTTLGKANNLGAYWFLAYFFMSYGPFKA